MPSQPDGHGSLTYDVAAMVASQTLAPAVTFRFSSCLANLPIADAREMAHQLLTAAACAESDAAVAHIVRAAGGDNANVVTMLAAIRRRREEGGGA
jgi:hypothetical protein